MRIKASSPGKFVDLRDRCGNMTCKSRMFGGRAIFIVDSQYVCQRWNGNRQAKKWKNNQNEVVQRMIKKKRECFLCDGTTIVCNTCGESQPCCDCEGDEDF